MSDKRLFTLVSESVRDRAIAFIRSLPLDGCSILYSEKKRTLDQNAKLWSCLSDISKQVVWYGDKLSPDDWKQMLTASLKQSRVVKGIDGGVVIIGASTSRMSKREFSDLIELMYCFGAEHGVVWSERSEERFRELRG